VLVFLCELFFPEGLDDDSADDSALVDFSVLVDFFELFVGEGELEGSARDAPLVPCGDALDLARAPEVDLLGTLALAAAEAVALGEAVAEAVSLGDAVAAGEVFTEADALGEG
jgi:hypothetical protein